MGLFSKLKSHGGNSDNDEIYTEIFRTITDNDCKAMEEISECISAVKIYANENPGFYDSHNVNTSTGGEYMLKWMGCIDIAIKNGFAVEVKDDNDFDGFYEKIGGLKFVQKRNNLPDEDSIYLDYSLSSWVKNIDFCWSKSGMCMGGIDLGDETFVIFPCTLEQITKLSSLAEKSGRKICRASQF